MAFGCFIRQEIQTAEDNGKLNQTTQNSFYVQFNEGGIKYTYNQGHPSVDNPKHAARHFLLALDRVGALKESHEKELHKVNGNIPVLEKLISNPFEKDAALQSLKLELAKIEKEILSKMSAAQMGTVQTAAQTKEQAPVVEMKVEGPKATNKMQQGNKRKRGLRM